MKEKPKNRDEFTTLGAQGPYSHEHVVHLHVHDENAAGATKDMLLKLLQQVTHLKLQGDRLMATLQEVKDELVAVKAAVDAVKVKAQEQLDEIARLKALIESGTAITQADLDALDAQVDDILAALTPAEPPPPVA